MNIKRRNPSDFNPLGLNRAQIAHRAGLSWPTVDAVLKDGQGEVWLSTYLAIIVALRPADWQSITLGELFTIDE